MTAKKKHLISPDALHTYAQVGRGKNLKHVCVYYTACYSRVLPIDALATKVTDVTCLACIKVLAKRRGKSECFECGVIHAELPYGVCPTMCVDGTETRALIDATEQATAKWKALCKTCALCGFEHKYMRHLKNVMVCDTCIVAVEQMALINCAHNINDLEEARDEYLNKSSAMNKARDDYRTKMCDHSANVRRKAQRIYNKLKRAGRAK